MKPLKSNFTLDHITITARSLEDRAEYVKEQLGVDMPSGGNHP